MAVSLLNVGARSLSAAQGSLGTIAHNIANANTAGYSRQEAVLTTSPGTYSGSGFFGRGVDISTVRRQYDQFLVASVQNSTSQASAASARSSALEGLDSVFADAELGIGAAVDAVFSAAGNMASRPADMTARQSFVSSAGQLAERITTVGSQLADMGRQADARLTQDATQVNLRLTELKALNTRIAQAQASGQAPNDLLDQRDVAMQSLGSLMAVTTVAASDGSLNIFTTSGAALLVGGQQAQMKTVPDAADPTQLSVQLTIGSTSQKLDAADLAGGSLAGTLRFRDEDLAAAVNQIGRIAQVGADRFNTQQAAGVDASGAQGTALFSVPAPVTQAHTANTGGGAVTAAVADSSALIASDYNVAYDGSNFTITRMSDGTATSTAGFPATVDGLKFNGVGGMNAGDSWTIKPFAAASTGLAGKPLAARQVATGFAAGVEAAATNKGGATATGFKVVTPGADNTLPVTFTFNNPPTSFNVTGLAGGNLTNVPYTAGQTVPASPADYNGWSLVLDGVPVAGDSFSVKPTTSPAGDNRNALAMGALAGLKLVDGATINEAYAAVVGDVGTRVQGARDTASVTSSLKAEASSRQQNLSGVNLDEEAANLLRFQQAYQASAKIIQASQTVFEALLSVAGR